MVSNQEADHINTLTTEEGLMGALKDGNISKKHRDLLSQGKYGQAILKEYDERFGTIKKEVAPTKKIEKKKKISSDSIKGSSPNEYTVIPKDNLTKIARKLSKRLKTKITVQDLLDKNEGLTRDSIITPKLKIRY